MARRSLITNSFAAYVVAFIAFGVPNRLLAQDASSATAMGFDLRVLSGKDCECKKIAPGVCNLVRNCSYTPAPAGYSPGYRLYGPLKILETGYSLLTDIGGEEPGYGLYSYALAVNNSSRSGRFLDEVLSAIPPVEHTAAQSSQINIFYIPLNANGAEELLGVASPKAPKPRPSKKRADRARPPAFRRINIDFPSDAAAFAKEFYDYKMSRTLLNHLCESPANEIKAICEGDLSRGPYIFTYARPASNVTPVPPPFLFMDLSNVHERAFPEIIAAFKAQVKREDISDRAKIDTLRLQVLNIVLTTADWLVPVRKAVADIVYSPSGQTEKDKK